MDILIEREARDLPEVSGEKSIGIRWLVMQSLKHQKWVLAVVKGTFEEYCVTDMMSENVELMVQCADYLNRGIVGCGLDPGRMDRLEQLRHQYCV